MYIVVNMTELFISVIWSGKGFSTLIPTILEIFKTEFLFCFVFVFCCGASVPVWTPKCVDHLQYCPFSGTELFPDTCQHEVQIWKKKKKSFLKWVIKFSSLHSTHFPHFLDQSYGLDWVQRERFFRSWTVYMISEICVTHELFAVASFSSHFS